MTIYMTSDLHVDHYINHRVSLENYINNALKPADVLCVAGDTCDDPHLFVEFYKAVSPRYKKIFVVNWQQNNVNLFVVRKILLTSSIPYGLYYTWM